MDNEITAGIERFDKDSFFTTAPYEYLYEYRGDVTTHSFLREQMASYASSVGVRSFKRMYDDYVKSLKQAGCYMAKTSTFTGQPIEIETGYWNASDSGIYADVGAFRMDACAHPIMPVERLVNIDTGLEKLKIAFRRRNRWQSFIAEKSDLASPNTIIKYANHGISVSSENAKHLIKYLQDIEDLNHDIIPEIQSVGRLGWIDEHGFSPYVDGVIFDGDSNYRTLFQSVETKGVEQDWMNIASEVRGGSISGRIVLAASFASVLVKLCGCLSFFVHLWGNESGTGKTVALMLAASVWADPEVGKYIQTFNSTMVGREKTAAFLNSLPMIIDELQLGKDNRGKQQFDVYALAESAGRTRGNKTGGIDKTPTWLNCIITSGETPIVQTGAGAGAMNRVIDIECTSGNSVVKDGHRVANAVRKSYGHAGRRFIEKLKTHDPAELAAIYQKHYSALCQNDTTEKQAMAAALILTADELATEWIFHDDRQLVMCEIKNFLLTKAQVSTNYRAFDFLIDWVTVNKSKFTNYKDGDVFGTIEGGRVYIIPTIFSRALEAEGYNANGFLSWLKSTGRLVTDSDAKRMTTKKIINNNRTRCYGITIGDENDENSPFDL